MSQLVIEGLNVMVARGSRVEVDRVGDTEPAWSGRPRSDVRAEHDAFDIETAEMSTSDKLALQLMLQSPGALSCTGELVGETTRDFHRIGPVEMEPIAYDAWVLRFRIRATEDARQAAMLFSIDGDALGDYTFTRSGAVGDYVDANGIRQSGAAANTPRISYIDADGDGLVDTPALLLEDEAINGFGYSDDLSQGGWANSNSNETASAEDSPDGGTNATKLFDNSSAGVPHRIFHGTSTFTADQHQPISGFVKAGEYDRLVVSIGSYTGTDYGGVDIDLGAETIVEFSGGAGEATDLHLSAVPNWPGWYYFAFMAKPDTTTTSTFIYFGLHNGTSVTYAGDGSSGLYLWRLNYDRDGDFYSSPIFNDTGFDITRGAETFYQENFPATPREIRAAGGATFYFRFQERGAVNLANLTRLFHLGSSGAGTDPRLVVEVQGGAYRVVHDNGDNAGIATLGASPTVRQMVEVRVTLDEDGLPTIGQSIAEGTEATQTSAQAVTLSKAAWAGLRTYLNGPTRGHNAFVEARGVYGQKTMAEMRALASARLWARD